MIQTPVADISAVQAAKTLIPVRDGALFVALSLAVVFAFRDALAAMVLLWNVSPM